MMDKNNRQLITRAAYARLRGCSQVAVHKAVRAGRISLVDGLVDPVVADAEWLRNSRPRHRTAESTASDALTASAPHIELKAQDFRNPLIAAAQAHAISAGHLLGIHRELAGLVATVAPILATETDVLKIRSILEQALAAALERAGKAS